jgi:hypothetical protein
MPASTIVGFSAGHQKQSFARDGSRGTRSDGWIPPGLSLALQVRILIGYASFEISVYTPNARGWNVGVHRIFESGLRGASKGNHISLLRVNPLCIGSGNFLRRCREFKSAITEIFARIRASGIVN